MFSLKSISRYFIILTILFETISSHTINCPHHSTEQFGVIPSSSIDTECLCKDLASAIQSVIISKMRRSSNPGPIFGTTGSVFGANNEVPKKPCPICAGNWQNSLARVLGMSKSLGQQSISSSNSVNVPYGALISRSTCSCSDYGTPTKNINVPNAYNMPNLGANIAGANIAGTNKVGVSNLGANNFAANNANSQAAAIAASILGANSIGANKQGANSLGANNAGANALGINNLNALLSRSAPNNGKYSEFVLISNMPNNGFVNTALV